MMGRDGLRATGGRMEERFRAVAVGHHRRGNEIQRDIIAKTLSL